jgi:hypothetical protein
MPEPHLDQQTARTCRELAAKANELARLLRCAAVLRCPVLLAQASDMAAGLYSLVDALMPDPDVDDIKARLQATTVWGGNGSPPRLIPRADGAD